MIIFLPSSDSKQLKETSIIQSLTDDIFKKDANGLLSNAPRAFTENCGQLENDEVRFYAQGGGVWFTDDGVWFELREYADSGYQVSEARTQEPQTHIPIHSQTPTPPHTHTPTLTHSYTPKLPYSQNPTQKYKRVILKQEFVGANLVRPVGRERLSWNSNFFYGNDSSKWCTEIPNFREIYYENLYDGIDLRYYSNDNGLKYDFLVHPGAKVPQIRIRYEGAEGLNINELGNLIVKTEIKDMMEDNLFIYQDYGRSRHQVDGKFLLYDNLEYGFEITENYSPQEILVIDPKIDLIYSTYFGGSNFNYGDDITVDSSRNAYITGYTTSYDFPTTPGAFDTSIALGQDCFVLKLDQNGSSLNYSTFIGGESHDFAYGITVDSIGNAYVTGSTASFDFPTTPGAFNRTIYSDIYNVFVLKLNQTGSSLIYSTFVTGLRNDAGIDIAIDPIGNAYITGTTESSDFPTTPGAFDNSSNPSSGYRDIFILKLNHNGSALYYSTFVGGNNDDRASAIAIDISGNAFVTGYTSSTDFPITPNAKDTSYNGGYFDAFALKLNSSGSKLIYSTFIGGSNSDHSYNIVIDSIGCASITGGTNSSDFPTTPGAYDRIFNGSGGWGDCFILKLNNNGSNFIFSTFIGGSSDDGGTGIIMDLKGNIIVAGRTVSSDFPTTPNAFNGTSSSGPYSHCFLLKLDQSGSELLYSTYIGGNLGEASTDIAVDEVGDAYLTGFTSSSDFPITPDAYCQKLSGTYDGFGLKFCLTPFIGITSLSLLKNETPINSVYSKLCPYTFRINITDTESIDDLGIVRLNLDPLGSNIQLLWDRTTGQFLKSNDPYNYINLESSSITTFNTYQMRIDFNITFNWLYPVEDFQDVQVYATSSIFSPAWLNKTNLFRVENDLVFNGTLSVNGDENRTIFENDLVRGGNKLSWSGLTVVYEDTNDTYPLDEEYDVTLWDENDNCWVDSPISGVSFNIETILSKISDTDGLTYIINLSGIPPECDKTNESFILRIDGENITFSNPIPDNKTWQTDGEVNVGITITDHGGGSVDGKNITYSISNDNGTTWNDWVSIKDKADKPSINVHTLTTFEDGKNNLIRWQAIDTVGNGPVLSSAYRVLVDTEEVRFSSPWPLESFESTTENVVVGINISDNISGINAESIEYCIVAGKDKLWSSWNPVQGLKNGTDIKIRLNITFANGTDNYIKWRASDIAGNGPTESNVYQIKVNTWLQQFIPRVKLWCPPNGSIIPSTSVELSWMLENKNLVGVIYNVYLDTINPPNTTKVNKYTETSLFVKDLADGETYYWTVIPKLEKYIGLCSSGVWSFSVNTGVPYPKVQLKYPENGSIINSPRPTLQWSVEYQGIEKLSYDIYLDTNQNPIDFEKSTNNYYLPNSILKDNTTYYWKVVPFAGIITGPSSEIYSFTVKRDYVPYFELHLKLEPIVIGLEPGGMKFVKAYVTNYGEITDSISLDVEIPAEADIGAIVNEPNIISTAPENIAIFNITVTATEDIEPSEVILVVTATSEKAAEYGKIIEVKETLKVIISETEKPGPGKSSDDNYAWIILVIIIIIILTLIILIFIMKKKRSQEKLPTKESVTIKPIKSPTPEKVPVPSSETQLSTKPTVDTSSQLTTTTTLKPTLAPSPSVGQIPVEKQMPDVQQKPQLPPVQAEDTKDNADLIKSTNESETSPSLNSVEKQDQDTPPEP